MPKDLHNSVGNIFLGLTPLNRPCITRYVNNLQSTTVFSLYTLCKDCSSMNTGNIVPRNANSYDLQSKTFN